MWTSRASWLDGLRRWAHSPAFDEVCAEARVSITAATLLAIAEVMATHADHATGRHVAVTRATIADAVGCDVRTVTAAWRVLRVSGWAVEAQRGHGSPTTPSVGRRPSVYHLVSRREARSAARQPVHDFHLPPSGGDGLLTPVGSNSPSVRARAANSPKQGTDPARRWRTTPRPLATQRLAAELVARTHGLGRGHIGAICDALTAAGIDPALWSARAITDALDADMRTRGWNWPDHIINPGAFLASRLRRLTWTTPPAPPKGGGYAATRIDQTPARATLTDAAQARIAAAREHIRQVLTERTQRTRPERIPCARSDAHAHRSIGEGMAPSIPNEPEQAIPQSAAVRRSRREECTEHDDADAFFRHLDRLVDDDAPSGSETAR
ncbi:rep protein [Mycolicibacterium sp.]|uniref:rep protein n=1 Tax=Mycolicibacterium sp. TaxID=2320850 RepID=UPI00355E737B